MTRIVFLTHSAAPAGAEIALLRALGSRPAEADVHVVFASDGPMVERFRAAGVPCEVLAMSSRLGTARRQARVTDRLGQVASVLRYSRVLRRRLRELGAEVVVGRSLKAVVYGRLATVGLGVVFVWCLHDRLTRDYLGRTALLWSRGVSRTAGAFVVNSRSTLSTVRTHGRPVLVMPPSVEPDDRPRLPGGDGLRVLSLARLSPWKGQDVALRAFAETLAGRSATLTVAGKALFGEDDYAASLHRLVDELGIGAQVEFVGHLDDPGASLHEHDVVLHSARIPEPFGMVVLEGLQAGCVVVATRPGGPAEMIRDGENGLLADAGDLGSLASALDRVGRMTPEEREVMGASARRSAQAYDAALLSDRYLTWLAGLAAPAATPALSEALTWMMHP